MKHYYKVGHSLAENHLSTIANPMGGLFTRQKTNNVHRYVDARQHVGELSFQKLEEMDTENLSLL